MRLFMLVVYILIIIVGVSFAALNASAVTVNFYVKALTMPISVLMAAMLGLGVFIGLLLFWGRYLRLKMECHSVKSQLRLTEKEIRNLRSIPLQDQH